MRSRLLEHHRKPSEGPRPRRGVTLVEVLVAIFITGVGLLALLELFPLSALELARELKDDRAAKLALDAAELSEAGEKLLGRTEDFIEESLANGKADPQAAAQLRIEYEQLQADAAALEVRLIDLKPLIQGPRLRQLYLASLTQIEAIQTAAAKMVRLLRLLEAQ